MGTNIVTLYHGTSHAFGAIDVTRGKGYKDFGVGFYATEDIEQATDMAFRNLRVEEFRLAKSGEPVVLVPYLYRYTLDLAQIGDLKCMRFDKADREWMKFVLLNRQSETQSHDYELVIGPTANDKTRVSIRTAINASNGKVLSDIALDLLTLMLEPDVLPTQYYFGTQRAADRLVFQERNALR
jgi:hypothetical protein